jgi:hypothetical protein
MPARNNYKCDYCGTVKEFIGEPDTRCYCVVGNWQLVFTETPQIHIEHASTVEYVLGQNQKRMDEIHEEDAAVNSAASKYLDELRQKVR